MAGTEGAVGALNGLFSTAEPCFFHSNDQVTVLFQQPASWGLSVQQWHHLSCLQSVPRVQRIWGNGVGAAIASSQRTRGRLPASVTLTVRGGCQGQVQPPSRGRCREAGLDETEAGCARQRRDSSTESTAPSRWRRRRRLQAPRMPPAWRSGSCRHFLFPLSFNLRTYLRLGACDSQGVNFGDFYF